VVIGSEADGSRDLAFVGISLRAPGQARAPFLCVQWHDADRSNREIDRLIYKQLSTLPLTPYFSYAMLNIQE